MNKLSYGLGLGIGQQLAQMNIEGLSIDDFADAIRDVTENKPLKMEHREAQEIVQKHFAEQEKKLQAERAEKGKEAKAEGEKFLAENAKKDGVKTTASGLQYKIIKEGSGKQPKATDKVRCHYEGFLVDGTVFDSSVQRGEPAVFPLDGVIVGWTEGLQLMKEGGKTRFFIPYKLAYGEGGAGASIPPFATLVFDVELIDVL
ncbi:FKBP-type peptidyl-prolyl cis-trans isomerase [Prevotella sp. OH937_COT-195]|uniref:FKBP-type peptidyl-prolyl cis-trans isomerase n=1 Tax=Prevotella sp. OH937_COT-195 TaxID=2491051 RepID=UPI000F6496C9|nr:FKBP-type peptidyl-prolyl cis-trans isomerase [Prevotella sp. OH937_COT-195]RRD00937.1 FKBP-type peptidyl-prolyl cis-trans isomerase [Prevotella sp. OH937_COT-195]